MASSTARPSPLPMPPGGRPSPPLALASAPAVRETHTLRLHTHASGRRMVNQYLVLSELGRGVHGRVRKATDTATGQPAAIKIVGRATRPRLRSALVPAPRTHAPTATDDKVLREIAILKQCASDHVVRLLEVIDDPLSKKLFLGACPPPSAASRPGLHTTPHHTTPRRTPLHAISRRNRPRRAALCHAAPHLHMLRAAS